MRGAWSRAPGAGLAAILALALAGCTWLPKLPAQPPVDALPPAESGDLAAFHREVTAELPPGDSAFLRLSVNEEALSWRLELIERATTSIDAQYFIWDADEVSYLLFLRLLDAADRGVRVRLMVDDIFLLGRDRSLAALSKHPHLDVRIFNPGRIRDSTLGALGEFLLKFRQLNRRMHNKLLVVDNRVAIVGGRNVGNAYFGLSKPYNFRDLDILVTGPVVEEISHAFDDYWNAEVAYPAEAMSARASADEIGPLRERASEFVEAHLGELASFRVDGPLPADSIDRLVQRLQSGEAHFLQDDPVPVHDRDLRLIDMLQFVAARVRAELIMISPYFIPRPAILQAVAQAGSQGISVKVLTASLASTNHTVAHAHYKKYRRRILESGAQLFEYRGQPSKRQRRMADTFPVEADFISLHTKALIADRRACFVGSLNLDPRAVEINTENGLYLESEGLCGALARQADQMMAPENAWRVDLDDDGELRWTSARGIRSSPPARGFWQRVSDFFYRWLPIEGQL